MRLVEDREETTTDKPQQEVQKPTPEELFKRIEEMLPHEAGFVKAEFEGPDVIVWVKRLSAVYANEQTIKSIAIATKKKLIIRSESSSLMEVARATEEIKKIIPETAGVKNIRFVPEFSEVCIEALKPGLVIGKGGATMKSIASKTGWVPKILRVPTMDSETITGVRQLMFSESGFRKKFLKKVGNKINTTIAKSEWFKATALGGFQEVGRSSLLLETPKSKVLIDCGISPEPALKGSSANTDPDTNKAFPYLDSANMTIGDLDAIIITHGHMDHIGFVPYLYKFGYEGPTYCTTPTREIAALQLTDYIKLVQRSGGTTLYDEKDVKKMLMHMITREYEEVTNITDELKLTYHNAGHILGSSTVHLHVGEGMYNIVHSGDMKYGFSRLLDPASTRYPRIDTLFIESTNGGPHDISPNRRDMEKVLMDTIKRTIDRKGKVLIPVFSLGRSQELQLVLENYMTNNPQYKMDVPVYLDGMLIEDSAIHTAYPEYLKEGIRNRILNNRSPFESEIFAVAKGERKEEIVERGPSIILASGGMLNGGVAVEYFKRLAEDKNNALFFVGYNSATSLGRRLQNGLSEVALPDESGHTRNYKIAMEIHAMKGFSGHSDRHELLNFVQGLNTKPKNIFTMHGDKAKCEDLARAMGRIVKADARAPMNLESMRLK